MPLGAPLLPPLFRPGGLLVVGVAGVVAGSVLWQFGLNSPHWGVVGVSVGVGGGVHVGLLVGVVFVGGVSLGNGAPVVGGGVATLCSAGSPLPGLSPRR